MTLFKPAKRTGRHWQNLRKALEIIEKLSLDIKSQRESKFEDRISGALQPNFDNFIDQRNIQQVITRITLFAHDHRPDMSIDTDGTAIEVKYAKSGSSFREAIGQAMIYRLGYRFVIVVWVDTTKHKVYKRACNDPKSDERRFLKNLEEHNVFGIVK